MITEVCQKQANLHIPELATTVAFSSLEAYEDRSPMGEQLVTEPRKY